MVHIYRVTGESRHFSFEAFGVTEAQAREAFRAGLSRHCAQNGAGEDWADDMAHGADVTVIPLASFWRDGEAL